MFYSLYRKTNFADYVNYFANLINLKFKNKFSLKKLFNLDSSGFYNALMMP